MRTHIIITYPNEYALFDSQYDIYYYDGRYTIYLETCYNENIAAHTAEEMEKWYNTEYITVWLMRK